MDGSDFQCVVGVVAMVITERPFRDDGAGPAGDATVSPDLAVGTRLEITFRERRTTVTRTGTIRAISAVYGRPPELRDLLVEYDDGTWQVVPVHVDGRPGMGVESVRLVG